MSTSWRQRTAALMTRGLRSAGYGVHPLDQVTWVDRFDQLNSHLLADVLRNAGQAGMSAGDRHCLAALLRGSALMIEQGTAPESQLAQDCLALGLIGRDGYFLDIGAATPGYLSNTMVLESKFGWSGLVVEPQPEAARLQREARRPRTVVAEVALGDSAREERLVLATELSSLESNLGNTDGREAARYEALDRGAAVAVSVVTPSQALHDAGAPAVVDFMSLDIEGGELQVLRSFPFDSYTVRVACVEHNDRPDLADITAVMRAAGLQRVLTGFSEQDAWYVHADLLPA